MGFTLDATARTPAVILDDKTASLTISGESYPEDVPLFYEALTEQIVMYFGAHAEAFTVHIKLTYFNSSSARALMDLLDLLDGEAGKGRAVTVKWYCDPDDDITREFAEDISADVAHLQLTILDLEAEA